MEALMYRGVQLAVLGWAVAAIVMVASAGPISRFVDRHPTIKMLALSFLLLIGFTLIVEGLHQHIPACMQQRAKQDDQNDGPGQRERSNGRGHPPAASPGGAACATRQARTRKCSSVGVGRPATFAMSSQRRRRTASAAPGCAMKTTA